MSVINGTNFSQVIISAVGDAPEIIINLPLTNEGGLVESYSPRVNEVELISVDTSNQTIEREQDIIGMDIFWKFNYNKFISGETLLNFQTIYRSAKNKRLITLIPRQNKPNRTFIILWDGQPFDLGLKRGGVKARYNSLFDLGFKTKYTEPDMKWELFTPEDVTQGGSINLPHVGELEI